MATLNQLSPTVGDVPGFIVNVGNNPIVEPLGGPLDVSTLMDRFPIELYDLGKDTHLYRLLTALVGDSGSGLLAKQAYAARLLLEGSLLTFSEIDNFYTQTFKFSRIKSELYPIDPATGLPFDPVSDALTTAIWNMLEQADNSYKQRVQNFFNATRLGNSPGGIELAALSATGVHIDAIENYKAIYDTLSDDPLNITVQGITVSPNEFILTPRVTDLNGSVDTGVAYTTNLAKHYDPIGNVTTWTTASTAYLNPDLERNMINVLDRLRPVHSLMTVTNENIHYTPIPISYVTASSEKIHVTRYVTGKSNVTWPTPDASKGLFVTTDENEAPTLALSANHQKNTYQRVDKILAYTEAALDDPTYNSPGFLDFGNPRPYQHYRSEHQGVFYKVISSIFTFLLSAPSTLYDVNRALPANNELSLMTGKSDNNAGI